MKKKECVQEDNCQKISEPDDTLVDAYGVHYIHDVIVDITKGNNDCPEISYVRKSVSFMRSKITYLEDDSKIICYFMHKCLKYVWDCETNRFELLRGWHETSYAEILNSKPLNNETVNIRRALYGINEISINVTPVVKMLLEECLNPFYCFQIFSCILWYSDEYWMYATCIVVISVTSLAWQVYELRRNEQTLKETMCTSSSVIVCREDGVKVFKEVDSVSLVPGDIIEIPHNGCLLQCDAVLLAGSCIVNESTLTGESVPVTKIPLPDSPTKNSLFDIKLHGRYILFSGTTVIQTRNYADERVLAVVARTGFYTVKGELVRSILYPKPLKFKFTQDSFRFIFALSILAVIGLGVSIYLMIRAGVSTGGIIKRALDLITVVVPPALPVVMTVGAVLAQRRLRSHGIFCVNPNVINVCGVIDVACFDKDGIFKDPELEPSKLDNGPLKECLATCHSLTLIEGTLSGDPLDLKMFQSTKWEIPYEVGILRQFPFSSSLQRMSVITRALNQNHFIPRDFHSTLLEYTREGYRVLALAWKPLKATYAKVVRVSRERVEQDLRFLGLLIMENRLKPETTQVIQTLRYANIRPVMVTGDNMLTALSVARDCEMIDELDRIILVSAKPPASHSSSPCDSSTCDVSSRLKDQQSNVASSQHFSVNLPPTLPATKTPGKTTRSRIYSSFNTPNSVSQENVFAQQDDSLVEFHYAEDLHKPVTEVTATIKTGTTGSHRRSQPGLHTADDEGLREFSLKDAKKSRKFTRRLYTDIPCVCENNSSSSLSPLTNIPQVCNVTMNNQPHVSSSTEQNHHHYQSVNDTSIKNHSKSISNRRLVFTRPVSIRMLDRPDFHLAMSGKTWGIIREYYPWLIPKLVVKGTVFARFHPEQKAQLIESLQSVGYFVSMCGDGANDCGALKVAHAGIALSEAEASVASPFTSKQQNISCVPTLIREGRCALTTSFGAFKFMVGYSMIQFFSVILLYYIGSNLSDLQFLFIDLFLITTLGLTFGYTPAYPRLSVEPPGMRLVSTVTLLSLSLQYLPLFTYDEDYELKNYESTAIFTVSVYQYVILAIVFSKSAPYRKSILHNPFGNLLFGYILESIVDGVSFRQRIRHIHRALFPRHISRKDYEHIRDEIDRLAGIWPPIIRSASVQALPKELFNESDVVTQISQTSRKRYNSRLSTDSEEDDNYISAASKEKAVLCNGLLDSTVHKQAQSHFNQSQFQPHFVVDTTSKGAIEKSAHKKRTRSTSRRHSFSTSLGKDGVKHGTSKESTPKQQTPTDHQMPRLDVLTPIGHARRFRSQSGPRPFYRNSIDFHSATKC
ncbi:putative cation-transporting ATPase 13A3 [Schistosoma japonicum]|nr:putative cation-transporting ATPase 13A3 [Schistosoma japonicum]